MSRSASSLLLTSLVAASLGFGCRKSEQSEPAPNTGSAEQKAAPAAAPAEETIKIGQTMPYSGPASAYGAIGKLHAKYFEMINKAGGINGKKIELVSLDDSYSPPKSVEQVRKLVEQDKVLAIFNPVGTPSSSAVQKYLNEKKVPQLFVATGANKWADPQNFPWTIGFNPSYRVEGRTYAEDILKNTPKAKIAILYQNDDFGKDILAGIKEGLGDKKDMIVAEASYEATAPTIDSQMVTLKGSKADVFINVATPKFAAQAIRKFRDLGWKAKHYVVNVSASIGSVLTPAGLENAKGLYTVTYMKDATDPKLQNDADVKKFLEFMKTEHPEGNPKDGSNAYAYVTAQTLVEVLKKCDGDYSPANIMKQAANLKDFHPDLLKDGININTGANDFEAFDKLILSTFDGTTWVDVAGAS